MKKHLLLLLSTFSIIFSATSQNATITGTVRDDETKDALPGANIKYERTKGSVTDASGKYTLNLPAGEYELVVTFVGYKNTKEKITVVAGEKKELNFLIKSSAIQINQVVTVSQYKKNAAKESVTTEVISKAQIKNTNSNDLGEVVSKTPGVLVQDGQISIRGGSSYSYGVGSRTSVLSDGLSLMSADLGEGQSKMIAVENIKQVEVTKGASSVVYGSSALNGVVNVITEWPTDVDPKNELETNVGVYDNPRRREQKYYSAGQPAFGSINFNHQQKKGNLQAVAGGNITFIKSYLQFADEFRIRGIFKLRHLNPKIEGLNYGINGNIQYETSDRFFISKNLDSFAYFRAAGSGDKYTRTSLDPFVSYQNLKGHRVNVQWRYLNIFREGGPGGRDAVSNQIITDNQYQYRYKNGLLLVSAGLPFTVGVSSSNLYPGTRINYNVAAYTQVELNYKILSLQGGLRYEIAAVDSIVEKGRPVFRSGLNIQAAKATFFRASWGQGYRIPTIAEKYLAQQFVAGVLVVPNDTLKAESGWGLELGFKQGFKISNWSAYFDAAFFWQQYNQFIEYQLGVWDNKYSNGLPIFPDSLELPFLGVDKVLGLKALNIENARVAGYELGLAGAGKIGPVDVRLLAGYTYTWPGNINPYTDSSRNKYSVKEFFTDMFKYNFKRVDDENKYKLLYYRIRHLFRADVELKYWKVYLGATLNYGSTPEKTPPLFDAAANLIFGDPEALNKYLYEHRKGEFFMDMRMGYNVNDKLSFGFIIKNLTNRFYSLRPGKPEPPRSFTLQARYTF
jgi:iron complex outermembrane receptor protein